jgi:hypothetical protein
MKTACASSQEVNVRGIPCQTRAHATTWDPGDVITYALGNQLRNRVMTLAPYP